MALARGSTGSHTYVSLFDALIVSLRRSYERERVAAPARLSHRGVRAQPHSTSAAVALSSSTVPGRDA